MNYYVLNVKDNKEFSVKIDLEELFGTEIQVIMPFSKSSTTFEGNDITFFNRLLPSYLIIGMENLNKKNIDKIMRLNNIEGFLYSSTPTGNEPAILEKDEVKQHLKNDYSYSSIDSTLDSSGDLIVLDGPYRGKTCRIKYKTMDYFSVIVNTRKTPEVKLPVWCLGKISKEKK